MLFDYRGAGAVEFSANGPFFVSAEVYIKSENGKYTTVVRQPATCALPMGKYRRCRSQWLQSNHR